tara:strand:- start:13585 stop:14520 length:936 start_codon:yes stop_codon:yes gene_type:complete
MDISIVLPTYNEEESVKQLYDELTDVMQRMKRKYELIFIDDGSTDTTHRALTEIAGKDPHVVIVKLRKNFGQTPALMAGFNHATGKILVTLDADLQNDPADIPKLIHKLETGHDVVCGWRMARKDNVVKKLPSKLSNFLNRKLTGLKIHDSGCTLRAYRREAVEGLKLFGENHRYIPALIASKGYKVSEAVTNHRPRRFGKSKYGVGRLMKGLLDLLTLKFLLRYSERPVHILGTLGAGVLFLGGLSGAYLLIEKFVYGESIASRPMLILTLLLVIMGVQLFFTGVLAEMLVRTRHDPRDTYSIEKVQRKK